VLPFFFTSTFGRPLGASLDGFFLGGHGGGDEEEPVKMELEEAPSFLAKNVKDEGADALDRLQEEQEHLEQAVLDLYQKQRAARPPDELRGLMTGANERSKRQRDALLHVVRTVVLFGADPHRCLSLLDAVRLVISRVSIALAELGHALGDPNMRQVPSVALVIVKQPFPCVFTKGKAVEDGELQVELLLSPSAKCEVRGPVEATLKLDPIVEAKAKSGKKATGAPLSNFKTKLNNRSVAVMSPKFELGSRKTAACFVFSVPVTLDGQQGTITSETSAETIIITNESQWEGSEGILLRNTIFAGHKDVSWPYFANVLQRHFLIVTRQNPECPTRPLSRSELAFFLNSLLGGKQVVDAKSFGAFWDWYGKCLQVLRYQRHIGSLWNAGLLLGFVSRQDVNNALHGRDPGTFLIRFSERHAGQFAVAYVGYEMPRKVKHYLVQPTDTASAKKTLPDFLAECHQFQKCIELKQSEGGGAALQEVPKDDAFASFLSKVDRIDPGAGYDQLQGPPRF
jgi:hypothetical protein